MEEKKNNTYIVEYVWIGGNDEFRSKTRVIRGETLELLNWNYDGSSTNQAITENSEVILKPVQKYFDKKENKYYFLCETFKYEENNLVPLSNNHRYRFTELINNFGEEKINSLDFWFGFEQEFFILELLRKDYLGFDRNDKTIPDQGPYYCGVENIKNYTYNSQIRRRNVSEMRKFTELIFAKCLDLDLGVTGWNLEVAPAQTEIQVFGKGIKAADDLMMMRFLTHMVLAEHLLAPDFHPKPLGDKWNGSGLHTNVSTLDTRNDGGYEVIKQFMEKFSSRHTEHIVEYGDLNNLRLTGIHETSSLDKFTWGVASRASSVRIPRETEQNNKGYFEDRRPAGWANPYRIACRIMKTILE